MKRTSWIGIIGIGALLFAGVATAEPIWSQISIQTTPSNAPKVAAAADKLMNSEVGKTFPGKLLLQASLANGSSPATHVFVPIYKTMADREAFAEKLRGTPAWTEFQTTMEGASSPVSTVLYNTVKSWGDRNDTDHVWMAHAFAVSDPAKFVAALDQLLASETGKKFPGQAYLSAVVAGGITPVTHVISVGYASEAEMAAWTAERNASADWRAYQAASRPVSDYLGGSLARDMKSWGAATLPDLVTP